MKSQPGPPMTLGAAAAARVRLIVWCRECATKSNQIARPSLRGTARQRAFWIGGRGSSGAALADQVEILDQAAKRHPRDD